MSVPFLLRTAERIEVASPWDTALMGDEHDAVRTALLRNDIAKARSLGWPGTCVTFELRGLSPTEVRILEAMTPPLDADLLAALTRVRSEDPIDDGSARMLAAYFEELGIVYLRLALEGVHGLPEWPDRRESRLGRRMWPAETLDGLHSRTLRWLGQLAWELTALTPEKKSHSGSPPDGLSGTTEAPTRRPTAAVNG